jgi:probable F420-dependent oxidoreductase
MRWSIALPEPRAEHIPSPETLVDAARAIEAAGLDAGWVTDHPFPKVQRGLPGHHAWEPFAALAYLAAATDTLHLHTNLIVLPYRNPFLVAKAAATVDHLSHGRLLLTLGAGYLEEEFAALGVDLADREVLMEEGVQALRAAWTGEPVELRSPRWTAAGNSMLPPPARQPHPPLWRGGNSKVAIAHAARSFDGWAPFEVPPQRAGQTRTASLSAQEGLRERIALLRELAHEAGRVERLDVCLVRPVPKWLERPRSEALEELAALAEAGVTWIAASFQVTEGDELKRHLERLVAVIG